MIEHVKRLVLVPEHMAEQRKKPLVLHVPLTAQVNDTDSDIRTLLERQAMPVAERAKLNCQSLQLYLNFYNKRVIKILIMCTHIGSG